MTGRPRAVIRVHLDSFLASVEAAKNPDLRGRPLVVGTSGDPASRGVVTGASPEAAGKGVRPGMELRRARKVCPGAAFAAVDLEACEAASGRFMEILAGYTPLVESFGMDTAYAELTDVPDPMASSVEVAREIRAAIKRDLGLPATVGVGPNKLLAFLAARVKKDGQGVSVIRRGEAVRVLSKLPVERLPAVTPEVGKRLAELGVRTVGDLAGTQFRHLERNFGPVVGRALYDQSRGVDGGEVVPFAGEGAVAREVVFEAPSSEAYVIKETLHALSEDVAHRLKSENSRCTEVGLKATHPDLHTVALTGETEGLTDSTNDILAICLELLNDVDLSRRVSLLGVKASGLEKRGR